MTPQNLKVGFLLLDNHGGIGGVEKVLIEITKGLEHYNVESYIYCIHKPIHTNFIHQFKHIDYTEIPNFLKNKHPLRPRILYRYALKREHKRMLKQIGNTVDMLVVVDLSSTLFAFHKLLLQVKNQNIPLIAWPHGTTSATQKQCKAEFINKLKIFNGAFAIGDSIARELSEQLDFHPVITVYNPIEDAPLIKRKNNHFLYIGRIDDNKRVHEMVTALNSLASTDWKLDIIGSTGSVEEDEKFKQYLLSSKNHENITFHGWQEKPWEMVHEAGALILNSKSEGLPLVLGEAMMRGIACISSDCPTGPSDIITHGENGWLFDMDNQNELVEILNQLVSNQLSLPDAQKTKQSVLKFEKSRVMKNFYDGLMHIKNSHS